MERDQQICPFAAHPKWKGSPRTSVNYWRHRVEQTVGRGGVINPHLCARISYKGRRARFSLGTANKEAAASKAAAIHRYIVENGFAAALEKYRPEAVKPTEAAAKGATVGEFLAVVEKFSGVRTQTLKAYVQAFRKIVAEISSIPSAGKHTKVGDDRGADFEVPGEREVGSSAP